MFITLFLASQALQIFGIQSEPQNSILLNVGVINRWIYYSSKHFSIKFWKSILLRKQKPNENFHKSLQQFTHYPQGCVHPLLSSTFSRQVFHLCQDLPPPPTCSRTSLWQFSPSIINKSSHFALSFALLHKCAIISFHLIKVCWSRIFCWLAHICLFPFTYISNPRLPISLPILPRFPPNQLHHYRSCHQWPSHCFIHSFN